MKKSKNQGKYFDQSPTPTTQLLEKQINETKFQSVISFP